MIKVLWESNGSPSTDDKLAELGRMREKYQRERHLDEEYYASRLNYVEQAETAILAERVADPMLGTLRQQVKEAMLALSETNPMDYRVVRQKLRDYGYEGWQVEKLIAYASFIQARGWEAFYSEDAAFLRQKYAEAEIDPEKIDFRV